MNRLTSCKNDIEAIKPRLYLLFDAFEMVRSVYIFGSRAAGFTTGKSDLDVAIRLVAKVSPDHAHGFRMALMDDIEALFHCPVDIVILNSASLKLAHQVFRYGIPIYIPNPNEETEYRIKMQKAYFDFQYYINKENQDLRSFYGA